jgi:ankyrin repeat protein
MSHRDLAPTNNPTSTQAPCLALILHAYCLDNVQVLQLVQQQGVDVNAACGPEGRTALHAAAERGQHSCCSALLQLGADSYQYDARQVSALMLAAKHSHDQVLKVSSHLTSSAQGE